MDKIMIRREVIYSFVLCLALCAAGAGGQTARKSAQPSLPALSPQQIFKRVAPSVMVVESLDAKGSVTAFGSGVVIAPGRVITNRHVIEDGLSFKVEHDGKTWPAKLARVDPDHDLAELSVAGLNAPAVRVRASSTLAVGEAVYAIGAPEGLELTISEGLISGLRDFDKDRVIQTSAAISPGSSGGGLFDSEGRLVGITTFYLKEGQSLNFALPAEWTLALNRQPQISSPTIGKESPAFAALALRELGYKAYQAGEYGKAVKAYQEAIRLKPDDETAWVVLGAAYQELGQYGKAVSAEQEAIRLEPDDETAWVELGDAYGRLGQNGKAVSAEQEAIRLKPGEAAAWVSLGFAYDGLGQYGKAVSAEQEAIRLKPDYEAAWLDLGIAYDGPGQYGKAVSAEQEAIRLKPDDEAAWAELGFAYGGLGQYDKAVSAWQEAIRLKPGDERAWFELGVAYGGLGQYGKAVSAEQEAIRLKPDYEVAWAKLGFAYDGLGQYDKAVSAEQEAIRLKPDDEVAWASLGLAYDGLGQYDKAVSAEQEAVRLKPGEALMWYELGLCLKAEGRQSEVIKVYEKLKTLDPKMADNSLRRRFCHETARAARGSVLMIRPKLFLDTNVCIDVASGKICPAEWRRRSLWSPSPLFASNETEAMPWRALRDKAPNFVVLQMTSRLGIREGVGYPPALR